jgi:flagellar basal-body rod protein FlgB
MNGLFQSTTIPALEQAVNFAQTRHGVLAGNLANLDVPGYKVRDLSPERFAARLKEALTERDRRAAEPSLQSVSQSASDPMAHVGHKLEDLLYHDESTGSLELQVLAIAKNQGQHNLALSILASQFRLLQAAIGERA